MTANPTTEKLGPIRAVVGSLGAAFIYLLIRTFGRTVQPSSVPWLHGPFGSDYIGDKPYEECARNENLTIGLPVLHLHYRIEPIAIHADPPAQK